jgi:hypothetical protein
MDDPSSFSASLSSLSLRLVSCCLFSPSSSHGTDAEERKHVQKSETIAKHRLLIRKFSEGAEDKIDTSR